MFRRTRKPNYTHEETMALLEQIESHRHILFGKSTNHQRAQLWTFIADAVNAVPSSAGRTVDELKHRWKDMSRRVRMYTRGMPPDKIKNEQASFSPSIYFDAIMRIMGEDALDGSDFGVLTSTDSQNSTSRFAEDSHIYSINTEVDIKPDINVLNNFLSGDVRSHNLNHQFVQKSAGTSSQNPENTQNNVNQQAAATSANYMDLGIQFPRSLQHRSSSQHVLTTENTTIPSSSGHSGCGSSPVGSYTPWNVQMPSAAARPMRFDPVTQEVAEIDDYDPDSESTDGESSSSKLVISTGEKQPVRAGTSSGQKNFENTTSAELNGQPPKKKLRVNSPDYPLQALSIEELQKMYLIKKIHMINQKTLCFKLLEEKLKHDIILQQQTLLGKNATSDSQRCPNKFRKQNIIDHDSSYVDVDGDNEVNVDDFDSRPRNCDSANFEQSRTLSDVSNDNEEAINDDKKSDNQQLPV
ncbi:hypothetical protein BsWGS_09007 [Bradybaena similaris]